MRSATSTRIVVVIIIRIVIVIVISVIINRHPDGDYVCVGGVLEVVLVGDEVSSVDDRDELGIVERITVWETIKQINCLVKSATVFIIKIQVCEL